MENSVFKKKQRLHGLDIARFLAFAGMVFVNFHVVTGPGEGGVWAMGFLTALEGKAAATFVVLAGVGLGFGWARRKGGDFNATIVKRAVFLLVVGLLNSLIFPADILHYYAVYFLFGLVLIGQSYAIVAGIAVALPVLFLLMIGLLNYDAGWDWQTFEYINFWTPVGFVRNLMFNGWHPVVPWLSFLLLGILIERADLSEPKTQNLLMVLGGVALGLAYGLSWLLSPFLTGEDIFLVSVSPVPPMPLYLLAGSGAATLVIGGCLRLFNQAELGIFKPLAQTGKQALTLYIAHIIIGMGILEAFGFLGGQSAEFSIFTASLFIIFAVVYAVIWARFFKVGPIEWLMRRIAG